MRVVKTYVPEDSRQGFGVPQGMLPNGAALGPNAGDVRLSIQLQDRDLAGVGRQADCAASTVSVTCEIPRLCRPAVCRPQQVRRLNGVVASRPPVEPRQVLM
jgi:hypothetical protein